jgi:hypothetical protein
MRFLPASRKKWRSPVWPNPRELERIKSTLQRLGSPRSRRTLQQLTRDGPQVNLGHGTELRRPRLLSKGDGCSTPDSENATVDMSE